VVSDHNSFYITLQGTALLGSVDTLHSSFPVDAEEEYVTQGK